MTPAGTIGSPARSVDWSLVGFHGLGVQQLHDLLQLRSRIFVLEQACPYLDIDGQDALPGTRHLIGYEADRLVVCARSLAPRVSHDPDPTLGDARIGRVAVADTHRRRGLAASALNRLIEDLSGRMPGVAIRLDAQLAAESLYAAAGFSRVGDPFLDDGIEHVSMRRNG